MIKYLINKVRSFIDDLTKRHELVRLLSNFTPEDWNRLTSMVITNLYADGEKQYATLNKFIDAHEPSVAFSEKVNYCYGNDYKSLLMYNEDLTDAQSKLLAACKSRKINTKLVAILETIDEYGCIDNYDNYLKSIGTSDPW